MNWGDLIHSLWRACMLVCLWFEEGDGFLTKFVTLKANGSLPDDSCVISRERLELNHC